MPGHSQLATRHCFFWQTVLFIRERDFPYSYEEIINKVGSPNLKLLFDIYHMQVMEGDLIRRINKVADHIGLVHIAGCPGRGEPDESQEINYQAVMQALAKAGYRGYAAHEWIPTGDPMKGLKAAIATCDV